MLYIFNDHEDILVHMLNVITVYSGNTLSGPYVHIKSFHIIGNYYGNIFIIPIFHVMLFYFSSGINSCHPAVTWVALRSLGNPLVSQNKPVADGSSPSNLDQHQAISFTDHFPSKRMYPVSPTTLPFPFCGFQQTSQIE